MLWSSSKLAKLILNYPKPEIGTSENWTTWLTNVKRDRPVRYFISNTVFDLSQKVLMFPVDTVKNIRCYIRNRFVLRTNSLTADSKFIKPGTWVDLGDRFVYCLFAELERFVETECAYMNELKKPKDKSAGVSYLLWASSLTQDWLDSTDENFTKPSAQAIAAKEILELYFWYKDVLKNRRDPYDYYDYKASGDAKLTMLDKISEVELAYEVEDSTMLQRLIAVRKHLWT